MWINTHRKKIFAFVTIFVVVLSFVTTASAYAEDYDPMEERPQYPNVEDYSFYMYFPGGFGYEAPQPLYDCYLSYQIIDPNTLGRVLGSNILTGSRVRRIGNLFTNTDYTYRNSDVAYSTSILINNSSSTNVLTNSALSYHYDGRLQSYTGSVNYLYFYCGSFYYFPFTESTDTRQIFSLSFGDAENQNITYSVNLSFRFFGNQKTHNVVYSAVTSNGNIIIDYDDLMIKSGLYTEANIIPQIPIYITDFRVGADVANIWMQNFDLDIPLKSVVENLGSIRESEFVYNSTFNLKSDEIDLNLDLEWIWDGVNGFFNTPFLGQITLTHICLTFFVANLCVTLLAIINHLK